MATTIQRAKSFGFVGLVGASLLLVGCGSSSNGPNDTPASSVDNVVDTRQVAEDRDACHRWAVRDSGFDSGRFDDGAANKGAATGAVIGSIIGSREGNTGAGVLVGAVLGMMAGAAIDEQDRREAKAKAQREAELALRRSNYQRALSACLEGRGYTAE